MLNKTPWGRTPRSSHPAIQEFPPVAPVTVFLLALLICAIGIGAFEYMKWDIRRQNERLLANLADAKANQINAWIEERHADGRLLSDQSHFVDLMDVWLRTGTLDKNGRQWMQARLKVIDALNQYDQTVLLDPQGLPRLSSTGDSWPRDDDLQRLAVVAMREQRVILSDMHWGVKGQPEMDMVAPLIAGKGQAAHPVGALYFHIDPKLFLFPLIQSWPVASKSTETLLVRRDGNTALFLNELRHRHGDTLTLRLPLSSRELPAARALRGETGIVSGKDYRGEQVIAYAEPIKGLPWKMIAKIDETEVYAPVQRLAVAVGATTFILLFLSLQTLLARQRHITDVAQRYKLQVENQTLASRFNFLSEFANDIILLLDEHANILDANARATEAYGYSHVEFLKMNLSELLPADRSAYFDAGWRITLEQGHQIGEALHRRKDGSTFPIEFSGRRFASDGRTYVQSIVRDITERKQAETALLNQKIFLNQIIDSDPNRIMVTDAEGRYVLVNKAMAEAYRLTPQQMVGRSRYELNTPEEAALYEKLDRKVIETRHQTVAIVPSTTNSGKERWFLSIKVPMERPDGVLQVLGISVDITESKLADDKLRRSEALFRTLVEHLPHKIFMKDHNSVYTFCNTAYAEDLGISPFDIIGKVDQDFYPERMARKFAEGDRNVIASGKTLDFEESYLHNGQEKIVHALRTPLKATDGSNIGILGMFLDITERRQIERALLESEQRYHVWLDVAPVACIVWEPETYSVMEWNRMAETIFGWKREEVLGRNFLDFMVPQEAMEIVQEVATFPLSNGVTSHSINQNLTRSGKLITCEWYNTGLKSHDEHVYAAMSIGSDVTERVQIAELRDLHQSEMKRIERLKVAGEMAAGLTHELSQPLSAANNYLDACLRRLQRNEFDPNWQQRYLDLAHKQTERARKIINHFKSLLHREEYPRAALDVNQVMRAAANFLEEEIKRSNVNLKMDLALVPEIVASNVELEQVIFNLMKNAIEAMQDCPVHELRLSSRCEDGTILVEIGDSGKGIPGDELEQIFEQFHTTKRDGLGLGLAICRTIVTAHEGRIWVESTLGQGSTFHIALPVAQGEVSPS